jgi:hypothetical protein
MARQELARFLRDRRECLRPVGLGLPALFHMLAMSFSTRSSTERNGSLHSTVR